MDVVFVCQYADDVLELFFVGRTEENTHAKAVNQGQFLLHGIGRMQVVPAFFFVAEFFTYQVAAVGSGIDQNVFRLFLQSAFDHCL